MRAEIYTIENLEAGRLSIMAHPRGGDWLEDEIKALYEAGVQVLVSLLIQEEIVELRLQEAESLCLTNNITYISLPIIDRGVPSFHQTTFEFLERLRKFLMQGKHVAIHCRMGIGRSALVAASVLTLTGISIEQALEQLIEARGRVLPDTDEQREWVMKYANRKFKSNF